MTSTTTHTTKRFGTTVTKRALGVGAFLLMACATACSIPNGIVEGGTQPAPASTAKPDQATVAAGNPAGTGEKASVTVDNAVGGHVALSDGTTVDVPAGALPPGVDTITVTSSPDPAPSEYNAVAPLYVFGPDGTVFLKPIKVSIPFTAPAGTSTDTLTVLWSRSQGPGFDMVPTEFTPVASTASGYIAIGEVTHFSQGTCGTKFTTDPHPSADPYK